MWTVRREGMPEGVGRNAISINGKIYCFDPDREEVDRTVREPVDVYVFDPALYQWGRLRTQSLPDGSPWHSEYGRTVIAYGDSAYLWSRRDFIEVGKIVYRFDTTTMAWSRLHVSGRWPHLECGQTVCLVGSRVYLYGGLPLFGPPLPQIDFLDLETMRWHTVPTSGDMPDSPMYHSASAIGNRMYVWGGSNTGPGYDNSLVFLDTASLTWMRPSVTGELPEGREDHSSFVYEGELYVCGGLDYDRRKYFNSIHKYNPETSCWHHVTPKGSGPSARRCAGCCVIGQRVFVFGGQGPKYNLSGKRVSSVASSCSSESSSDEAVLSDMHVLDFSPTLRTMCLFAVIGAGVHVGHLPPPIKKEIVAMTTDSST